MIRTRERRETGTGSLGTEGDGFASSTIADCDYTVRIPMSHGADSDRQLPVRGSLLAAWKKKVKMFCTVFGGDVNKEI